MGSQNMNKDEGRKRDGGLNERGKKNKIEQNQENRKIMESEEDVYEKRCRTGQK